MCEVGGQGRFPASVLNDTLLTCDLVVTSESNFGSSNDGAYILVVSDLAISNSLPFFFSQPPVISFVSVQGHRLKVGGTGFADSGVWCEIDSSTLVKASLKPKDNLLACSLPQGKKSGVVRIFQAGQFSNSFAFGQ